MRHRNWHGSTLAFLLIGFVWLVSPASTQAQSAIQNGDFSQGLPGWIPDIFPGCAGTRTATVIPFDNPFSQVLELMTINAGSFCGGSSAVYQDLNVPVASFNTVVLSANVRAISASVVNGCGVNGTEYPFSILVSYLDAAATPREFWFGFHFSGGTCGSPVGLPSTTTFVSVPVPQGQWFSFNSGDLKATAPTLSSITRIRLLGNGWDYEGHADNLSLSLSVVGPPSVVSSLCGPNAPSRISGSTGAQGVLDAANTIPPTQQDGGLIWPGTAVLATLFLDTGQVVFTDAANALVGTAVLPGVSGYPAFPEGKLHFTNVRLAAGKGVVIVASASTGALFASGLGVAPAALVLSCADVVLEAGSLLAVGTVVNGAPILQATLTPVVMPGGFPGGGAASILPAGGLGPRLAGGSSPAAGSLYPAWGGAGGASGSTAITCGLGSVVCPSGGFGGGALVVSAAQKITVNGTVLAVGSNAAPNNAGAQSGAGGSVRLAAVLVEGIGTIDTAGGSGGAAGPIEIQGFVQNLFSGTLTGSATACTTNKDCAVVAPLPSNLPEIEIVGVEVGQSDFCGFECSNTGSLLTPDVTLDAAATVESVTVTARVEFRSCLAAAPALTLAFRAVGTDGSAQDKSASAVAGTSCTTAAQTPGVQDVRASAVVDLVPGVSYQIVVTPAQAFALPQREARVGLPVAGVGSQPGLAQEAARAVRAATVRERSAEGTARERAIEVSDSEALLEQWSRLFGVEPALSAVEGAPAGKRVARLSVAVGK